MRASNELYGFKSAAVKKITLILTAFLLVAMQASSQDTIYQRRGNIIVAHITETNKKDVKFYKTNDSDSIVYSLPIGLIDSVIFEDGSRKIPTVRRNVPRALEPPRPKALSPELVANNPFKISAGIYYLDDFERFTDNGNLSRKLILSAYTSIEKIFFENKFGVKLMPFIGVNRMAYGTAIGITGYPKPYYNVVFHTGPRLLFYRANSSFNNYNSADGYTVTEIFPANYIAFLYDAGIDVRINKNWGIETAFGIGRLLYKSKHRQTVSQEPYVVRNSYIFENAMINARFGLLYKF